MKSAELIIATPVRAPTHARRRPAEREARTPDVAVVLPPPPEVVVASAQTAPSPVREDAERYAARESNAFTQLEYQGGDAIVISLSVVLVIALIVVLILLLT